MTETRWTEETERMVREAMGHGDHTEGEFCDSVTVLAALADAGLLVHPAGYAREEWACEVPIGEGDYLGGGIRLPYEAELICGDAGSVWTRARAQAEVERHDGASLRRRTVHLGPWLEVAE